MREILTRCGVTRHKDSMRPAAFFLALLLLASAALPNTRALGAGATPLPGAAKLSESPLPWTITADKLTYDQEKQIYVAEGNVKISSKDRLIESDYANVDNQTRRADLIGNVTVSYGRNWVKGEHVIWNLNTETGWLDTGVLYFSENNFFVQGESIYKFSETQFEIKRGFLTSCNPGDPAWKIQFNDMNVTVGGTAWTKDASFWTRSLPVFYWPILGVPVETERQSGFLIPIAAKSGLDGYQIEIPYYWAFRPDMDATFYANYMSERGVMGGVEYRIDSTQFGKGIWMFNFLDDQASKTFLYDKGFPYQTEDRYWVRGKQDVQLPWGIEAKFDLDYVSDRSFLQEFPFASASLTHTSSELGNLFGRGILYDNTSLVRESDAYFEKKGESQLLSLDVRYWENLDADVKSQSTEELPSFSYSVIPKVIDGTPFYWGLQSSAVNYWREQGDTGQRLDLWPRLYYPVQWGNYLQVEPSVGIRGDSYAVQWHSYNFGDYVERAGPDVEVDMSTRLNRTFSANFWNITAIQNGIRPEFSYEYVTQTTSGLIPQFDRLDLDQSRNGVRYGLSSFLIAKEETEDIAGNPVTTYRDLARFRLFQFYNIQAPLAPDPVFDTNVPMTDGFSPIGIRLDVLPTRYLTVSYDYDVETRHEGLGKAQDLFATYDSTTGYIVRIDYEQVPNLAVNEITLTTTFKAYNDIYIHTYHNYSIDTGIMFTQGYGIRYVRGCWGVGVGYEHSSGDDRFAITVDLMGIGSVGREAAFFGKPLFGESRPGYQHPESWIVQ